MFTGKHYILHDLIHQLLVVVISTYNIIIIATIKIKTYLCVIAFNATFYNVSVILWLLVLLVKETGVSEENDRWS
jgi:hypothetical protein